MDEKNMLIKPEFPRSAKYDAEWIMDNQMGPNALWLTEWLCESLELKPGMRVLDLACGKAMSSIFLAKEFGVRVWAPDLWMSPDHNWERALKAEVDDQVCPLKAEAHNLPFAAGFFDAVVCVDAYQYFGTDELYIDYLSKFVRLGGMLGVVAVGLMKEFDGKPPAHLTEPQANGKVFWEPGCRCFKTPEFWRTLWQGSASVENVAVEVQPDGWRHWRDFEQALEGAGKSIFPSEVEALEKDHGENLCFIRLTAHRTEKMEVDIYDPALGLKVGVDV
jgi:cyclopropane fatty-acyl-phospholipid synthase-like methyltransferase